MSTIGKAALLLGVDIYTRVINENWDDFIIDIATYIAKQVNSSSSTSFYSTKADFIPILSYRRFFGKILRMDLKYIEAWKHLGCLGIPRLPL